MKEKTKILILGGIGATNFFFLPNFVFNWGLMGRYALGAIAGVGVILVLACLVLQPSIREFYRQEGKGDGEA